MQGAPFTSWATTTVFLGVPWQPYALRRFNFRSCPTWNENPVRVFIIRTSFNNGRYGGNWKMGWCKRGMENVWGTIPSFSWLFLWRSDNSRPVHLDIFLHPSVWAGSHIWYTRSFQCPTPSVHTCFSTLYLEGGGAWTSSQKMLLRLL